MTVDDTMTPRGQIESIDLDGRHRGDAQHARHRAPHAPGGVRGRPRQRGGHPARAQGAERHAQRADRRRRRSARSCASPTSSPRARRCSTSCTNFQENQRHMGAGGGRVRRDPRAGDAEGHPRGDRGRVHQPGDRRAAALFHKEPDGSVIADGACSLRVLNRKAGFDFPLDGPKTINGLLLEQLEDIPEAGTSARRRGPPDRDPAGAEPHGEGGAHPAADVAAGARGAGRRS